MTAIMETYIEKKIEELGEALDLSLENNDAEASDRLFKALEALQGRG